MLLSKAMVSRSVLVGFGGEVVDNVDGTEMGYDANPDFALDLDIARQYKSDRKAYERTVREWVQQYARPPH